MISKENLSILACPSCRSSLKLEGKKLVCSECGSKFNIVDGIPILIPKELEDDLALTQEKWNEEYTQQHTEIDLDSQPYLRDSFRHLLKFLPKKKGIFLELGCGVAKNSFLLHKETGMKVVGIDISLNAVRLAKKLFEKEKKEGFFVCGDIKNLPFKDNTFIYMYGPGTIEHFQDTKAAVVDLFRCLKQGGVLTCTVPFISLSTPYWVRYGNIPNVPVVKQMLTLIHGKVFNGKFQPFGYETSFTEGQLKSLFTGIGFGDIKFGLLETYYEIKLSKNETIKNIMRRIAKMRIFWPFVYINGQKPL